MYFLDMQKNSLFIADIFRSIQGEGPQMGTPSIFLRLGICNLHCRWCDTPYTWKKGMTDHAVRTQTWILNKIKALRKGNSVKNLVVTGGEPLLQQKQLVMLLTDKLFDDMSIEFETNGSMPLLPPMQTFIGEQTGLKDRGVSFNISPKLADSGNRPYNVQHYPNSVLKFVYVSKRSEKLIDAFLKEYRGKELAGAPVFIMPEDTTVKAMSEKYTHILKYCLKNGFRFTPRLHIYLFGNTRAT